MDCSPSSIGLTALAGFSQFLVGMGAEEELRNHSFVLFE
jgi:hypothetical protein